MNEYKKTHLNCDMGFENNPTYSEQPFVEEEGMTVPTWTFGGCQSLKSNISYKILDEGNNAIDNHESDVENHVEWSFHSQKYNALLQKFNDFKIEKKNKSNVNDGNKIASD